jgi:hypothetical protein
MCPVTDLEMEPSPASPSQTSQAPPQELQPRAARESADTSRAVRDLRRRTKSTLSSSRKWRQRRGKPAKSGGLPEPAAAAARLVANGAASAGLAAAGLPAAAGRAGQDGGRADQRAGAAAPSASRGQVAASSPFSAPATSVQASNESGMQLRRPKPRAAPVASGLVATLACGSTVPFNRRSLPHGGPSTFGLSRQVVSSCHPGLAEGIMQPELANDLLYVSASPQHLKSFRRACMCCEKTALSTTT